MASEKFDFSVIFRVINKAIAPLSGIGTSFGRLSHKIRNVGDSLKRIGRRATEAGKKLTKVGKTLTTKLTAPILGLGFVALRAFNKQEKAMEQVRAGIKATGGAAGRSIEQLAKMAEDLQKKTLFGDEEILGGATAQLLTFTNIAGKNFDRTQQAVLDVATRLAAAKGGSVDLTAVSIMLGKALNDPVANLGALGRSGIQFSKQQKEVIKSLSNSGKLAEAQSMILAELEKQYGGSAEAAANAGTGGITQLKNSLGDLMEIIGKVIYDAIKPFVKSIKEIVINIAAWLKENPKLAKIIVLIAAIVAAIGPLLVMIGSATIAIGFLSTAMGTLSAVSLPITGTILAISAGIAALTYGIIFLVKNWDDLLGGFKKLGPVGKIIMFILGPIMFFIAQIKIFISIVKKIPDAIDVVKNAFIAIGEFISSIVSNITGFFSMLKSKIPAFIGKKLGLVGAGAGGIKEAAAATKSETEVRILVQAAKDSEASIEDVKKPTGDAKIKTRTSSSLNPTLFPVRGGIRI